MTSRAFPIILPAAGKMSSLRGESGCVPDVFHDQTKPPAMTPSVTETLPLPPREIRAWMCLDVLERVPSFLIPVSPPAVPSSDLPASDPSHRPFSSPSSFKELYLTPASLTRKNYVALLQPRLPIQLFLSRPHANAWHPSPNSPSPVTVSE